MNDVDDPSVRRVSDDWIQPLKLTLMPSFFFGLLLLLFGCDDQQRAPVRGPIGPILPSTSDMDSPDVGQFSDIFLDSETTTVDAELDMEVDAEVDSATFPEVPFAIETRVGERRTRAGLENRVTCQVLNQVGEPIESIDAEIEVQPSAGFERTENGLIGRVARDYDVVCTAPRLGLRDATPGIWSVTPDRASKVVTSISASEINAGETVDVSCLAFDDFGNSVYGVDFDLAYEPQPARLERDDLNLTIESSGTFAISCTASGVEELDFVSIEVSPGLPAQISILLDPDQGVYRLGQVIGLSALASDRFGNPVPDAPFVFSSDPALGTFGTSRFLADQTGYHTLTAEVLPPTYNDRTLAYEREILIDLGGPGITCDYPGFGEVVNHQLGQDMTFYGLVEDVAGVSSVRVNGTEAQIRADGSFVSVVRPKWGLNVLDVVATDANGEESSTFCSYYVADRFQDPADGLNDALQIWLGQNAVDDGGSSSPLQSLGDALRRMINSRGLRDTVHEAVSAQNPIVPNECRTRVLGFCLFRLGVDYQDYENNGPNQFSMTLLDNGFSVGVELREQIVRARLRGTLGNRVRLRAEYIRMNLTFDVRLDGNGRPDISVRTIGNPQVGDLDADFSGILGFLFELVFEAFEGVVRNIVVDAIKGFLQDNVDRVLTDLFANVDIGELGGGVTVSGLAGNDDVDLAVQAVWNRLQVNPQQIEVGLKTVVQGPTLLADAGQGVPMLPGAENLALDAGGTVAAGVRIGLLNQIMYALWRAGYFEFQNGGIAGGLGAGIPVDTDFRFRMPAHPWVSGTPASTGLRVFLGPLSVQFSDPVFESLALQVAAEFAVDVSLIGERDIEFTNVGIVDTLHISFFGGAVPDEVRSLIQAQLTDILERLIERALNDGLPSLPLPEFKIPASLAEFDLPTNVGLGLRQPSLEGREAIWSLGGNFGE